MKEGSAVYYNVVQSNISFSKNIADLNELTRNLLPRVEEEQQHKMKPSTKIRDKFILGAPFSGED